jgi:hypothetical protein
VRAHVRSVAFRCFVTPHLRPCVSLFATARFLCRVPDRIKHFMITQEAATKTWQLVGKPTIFQDVYELVTFYGKQPTSSTVRLPHISRRPAVCLLKYRPVMCFLSFCLRAAAGAGGVAGSLPAAVIWLVAVILRFVKQLSQTASVLTIHHFDFPSRATPVSHAIHARNCKRAKGWHVLEIRVPTRGGS